MDQSVDWTQVLQITFLALFVLFVLGGSYTTTRRLIHYRAASQPIPVLLWRDVIARNGLAIPFGSILVLRALRSFGVNIDFAMELWWILFTSLPAVIGAAYYLYCEIFVIDRAVLFSTKTELGPQESTSEHDRPPTPPHPD